MCRNKSILKPSLSQTHICGNLSVKFISVEIRIYLTQI